MNKVAMLIGMSISLMASSKAQSPERSRSYIVPAEPTLTHYCHSLTIVGQDVPNGEL
jgi:inhibitor of KinA sporulation pathway (predicted exonuclease)